MTDSTEAKPRRRRWPMRVALGCLAVFVLLCLSLVAIELVSRVRTVPDHLKLPPDEILADFSISVRTPVLRLDSSSTPVERSEPNRDDPSRQRSSEIYQRLFELRRVIPSEEQREAENRNGVLFEKMLSGEITENEFLEKSSYLGPTTDDWRNELPITAGFYLYASEKPSIL